MAFIQSTCLPAYAQTLIPQQALVPLSPGFTPALVRGIKVYPDNPLQFDFIVDSADSGLQGDELKAESEKLIRYFLASLTVPEDDLWVNLSPYESDRIVPDELGKTEMGIDMLAQDYLLKQITASLMNPEDDIGKQFWQKIYQQAYEQHGTTTIPVETFNKVWIMPDKAEVYVQQDRAFILEAKLKVMLEEDYVALQRSAESRALDARDAALENSVERIAHSQDLNAKPYTLNANDASRNTLASNIIRTIIIPALEHEVNFGKNFAQLRQIYHSLILAHWYKTALKESILNKVYSDQRKVKGLEIADSAQRIADSKDLNAKPYTLNAVESIYSQYLATFKHGVHNMIKVEYDPYTKKHIPRKYFAGGVQIFDMAMVVNYHTTVSRRMPVDWVSTLTVGDVDKFTINFVSADQAMASSDIQAKGGLVVLPETDNEVVWGWQFPRIVKNLIKFNLIPASKERKRIEKFLFWVEGLYKEGLAVDQEKANNTDRRLLLSVSIYKIWLDLLKETGENYSARIDELWGLLNELKKYEEASGVSETFFDDIGIHNQEELRKHLRERVSLRNIMATEETSKGADYQHLKRYWLEVNGGRPLRGRVEVGGSKHSVVTLMGGLLLANGEVRLENFPTSADGVNMLEIYKSFGVQADLNGQNKVLILNIDPENMKFDTREMGRAQLLRGSILLLGSALLRFGKIEFPIPGGDKIGRDFHKHFEILNDFGISHGKHTDDVLTAWLTAPLTGDRVIDGKIKSGSGAGYSGTYTTALAMILAAGNRGKTTINNAIVTSDIAELGRYLLEIGVKVQGLGTETLVIESPGIDHLGKRKIDHKIDPDKNEIVFWIVAAIMSRGVIDISIDFDGQVTLDRLGPLGTFYRDILEPMGIVLEEAGEKIFRVDSAKCRLQPADLKLIYSGNNANVVDPMMNLLPLLTVVPQGRSTFVDLKHGSERLRGRAGMEKMGAELIPIERGVEIFGAEEIYSSKDLHGADIRDASNLLLMSLRANGPSTLYGLEYIERAYDNILSKLTRLGADIRIKKKPILLTSAVTDSELHEEIKSFLKGQRFGPSLDNDEDQIYIKTLANTFKDEIRASLAEAKTFDDIIEGNNALSQAFDMNEYSRMFRYLSSYRELETKTMDAIIRVYIEEYKKTSKKQTLRVGIVGTSYGQELISLTVFLRQEIGKVLSSQALPLDAIEIKIHALNKPDPIFEKLKQNQIFYPKDMLKTYQDFIPQDQAKRLFEMTDKGIRRSNNFNQDIAFYDINLLDEKFFAKNVPPLDILFVHNVLHHVSTAAFENFSKEEALKKIKRAQEYIVSLVSSAGAISIIAQGDHFFGGHNRIPPEGFVLINPLGEERECIFFRAGSSARTSLLSDNAGRIDPAQIAEGDKAQTTGGIDFTSEIFPLNAQGQSIDFAIPTDMTIESLMQAPGLVPVIINITPVINIFLLMGLTDDEQERIQAFYDADKAIEPQRFSLARE